MKTKSIFGFMLLLAVALAQSGSTPRLIAPADQADRQASIHRYLEALDRQQRMDKMPGVGATIEQKLLRVLAEEALSLRQENAALKKAIEQSKKNG